MQGWKNERGQDVNIEQLINDKGKRWKPQCKSSDGERGEDGVVDVLTMQLQSTGSDNNEKCIKGYKRGMESRCNDQFNLERSHLESGPTQDNDLDQGSHWQ